MKNLLLVLVLCFAFMSNAQEMSREFLQGIWIPETYASELRFYGIKSEDFKIQMTTSDEDRESLEIVSYQFKKNNFYLKSLYKPTGWEAIGKFIIIDKNTIAVDYVSDAPAVVIYKRYLTN